MKHKDRYIYRPDAIDGKVLISEKLNELPHNIEIEIKLAEKPRQDAEAYFLENIFTHFKLRVSMITKCVA